MKKISRLKKIRVVLSSLCVMVIGYVQFVDAQGFITREERPRWDDRYENFSNYDMRRYDPTLLDRSGKSASDVDFFANPSWHGPADYVTYDRFGNFLLPGGDIYNLSWDLSTVGAKRFYSDDAANIFNNLMISSDEISNWETKFMVGTNLRAYFTPSTLKRTNFNGIRWDASSRKNSFTLVAAVGDRPASDYDKTSSDYRNLFGGHWESILGDVLKLGGSFVVNQRGTQSFSNTDIASGVYGIKETEMERYVYVVITDDSPEDPSNGARVYKVKALVNGKEADLPQRSFKIPDIIHAFKFSDMIWQNQFLFQRGTAADVSAYIPQTIENIQYTDGSWFLNLMNTAPGITYRQFFQKIGGAGVLGFVNLEEPLNPDDPQGRFFGADESHGYVEAYGTDASGVMTTSRMMYQGYLDAYGTDVIIYEFLVPEYTRKLEFDILASNDYCIDVIAAIPSRQQQYLAGWDDPPGEEAWGTGSWSPVYDAKHCRKAPGKITDHSNTGWVRVDSSRLTGMSVYGLNMEMTWRGLFIRGEINEYNSLWSYPVHEYFTGEDHKFQTDRAWFVNVEKDFGKWSVGGEVFDYPNGYMEYWSPVDDNDDNNRYVGGAETEYPGLNIDFDRAPDNQHIDTTWTGSPYITYYFDSISFGDDFNHNGIIDERENDNAPDLPYDRDSSGQHFFLKVKPREYSMFSFGHYDIKQEYRDGRNLTDYLKLEHTDRYGSMFEYGIFHRTERVQDNYKSDKSYSQYWGPSGRFNNLAYRDAWVNSSMVKTRLTLLPNFNIINNFKYDSIHRLGDLEIEGSPVQQSLQAPRDIISSSTVHKADYTFRLADFRVIPDIYWYGFRIMREKRIKEFKLQPQFKFVNTYYTADLQYRNNGGHAYSYYPVLRFDYRVAPKTLLRCAFQGFPGLLEKDRDSGDKLHDINRRRMFLGFETTTLYQGFNLLVTTGMRRDKQAWVKSYGRREQGFTEYFIQLRVEASR